MFETVTEKINSMVRASSAMTDREFFQAEIARWKKSDVRMDQLTGERYYRGKHDILDRVRTVIGGNGKLETVYNLPNNRIVDNQYAKMVDQKTDYLLGQPFTMLSDGNEAYIEALKGIFNRRFHRLFSNLGEDSLNCGIGWLYVYYDEDGVFSFRRFLPFEILPFWRDSEHTVLDAAVRVYEVEAYEGRELRTVEKVEIYRDTGIERYVLSEGVLIDDVETPSSDYVTVKRSDGSVSGYNWGRVPIVGWKYNDEEIPLINKVKTLQDALNDTLSDFRNNMQEDSRNTILVLKNYDGQDLGEFRRNLALYGVVKTRTLEGGEGGLEALTIEVNAENYRIVLGELKKAVIENAKGYDAKDERLSGAPNQMNILSMYSDIDLDANGMETEYQASLEDLLFFVRAHLANTGAGNFTGCEVEITFNRHILMNEGEAINNVRNSEGLLSEETLLTNHPWVDDAAVELKRIKKDADETYSDAFPEQESENEDT